MRPQDTTVFILGAGLGTRLRPITNTIPKVMVPIALNMPLLEHEIILLSKQGFRNFVINLHYLPDSIRNYFGDGKKWGVVIRYSDESDHLMGTAGAIKKAEHLLSDDFIFIYGDHAFFFEFPPLLEFHEEKEALATVVLKRSDLPQNGDIAEVDAVTSRIMRWHHRPHDIYDFGDKYFLNSGLYVLSKRILEYIPAETVYQLDMDVLPPLIREGSYDIYAVVTNEDILDIGTPEKYEYAKQWYQKMKQQKNE